MKKMKNVWLLSFPVSVTVIDLHRAFWWRHRTRQRDGDVADKLVPQRTVTLTAHSGARRGHIRVEQAVEGRSLMHTSIGISEGAWCLFYDRREDSKIALYLHLVIHTHFTFIQTTLAALQKVTRQCSLEH